MTASRIFLRCDEEEFLGLQQEFRGRLEAAFLVYQAGYREATGEACAPWVMTSGRRSLRQQAQEMSAMTPEQLRGLYCTGGIPSYVEELVQAMPLTEENAYRILQRRSEGYISKHLFGAAADFAPRSIQDPARFQQALEAQHLRLLDESPHGVPCFHVYDPAAPAEIVRE